MVARGRSRADIDGLSRSVDASLRAMGRDVADGYDRMRDEVSLLRKEWGARDSQGQWLDDATMARYAGRNRADIIRETDLLHAQIVSLREQRDLAEQRAQGHAEKASRAAVQLATLTASLDAVLRGLMPSSDSAYPSEARQAMTQLYEVLTSLREGQ